MHTAWWPGSRENNWSNTCPAIKESCIEWVWISMLKSNSNSNYNSNSNSKSIWTSMTKLNRFHPKLSEPRCLDEGIQTPSAAPPFNLRQIVPYRMINLRQNLPPQNSKNPRPSYCVWQELWSLASLHMTRRDKEHFLCGVSSLFIYFYLPTIFNISLVIVLILWRE
jgi:hypothetical protein